MDLLHRLQRVGIQRGVLGTSRGWAVVAVVTFALRQLRKLAGTGPKVVHTQELKPGESIIITHTTETFG